METDWKKQNEENLVSHFRSLSDDEFVQNLGSFILKCSSERKSYIFLGMMELVKNTGLYPENAIDNKEN